MLRQDGDDHGGIFRTLALVNGRGVGGYQGVQLAEAVGDDPPVEARAQLACLWLHVLDVADVAVVDVLVVIVFDLHHLVVRRKGRAETLDLALARRD